MEQDSKNQYQGNTTTPTTTEESIKKLVGRYIQVIAEDPVVKAFLERNERKSKQMAAKDMDFFNTMMEFSDKFARALILTNANQQFKLMDILNSCKALDEEQ